MPNSYRLRVTRGMLYVQQGNYESASRDFEKGEQLDPAHSFGSMAQGLSQLQQSKLDQALATTEAELRKNPGDPFLYYLKAETLRRQGASPGTEAFDQALRAAERAVALSPHFPLAQDLLGVLYQKSGKDELASRAFQAALRDDPFDQPALYHMLAVARKTGQSNLVPDLMKRLADAKQQAQKADVQASRYRIIDSKETGATQNPQQPSRRVFTAPVQTPRRQPQSDRDWLVLASS